MISTCFYVTGIMLAWQLTTRSNVLISVRIQIIQLHLLDLLAFETVNCFFLLGIPVTLSFVNCPTCIRACASFFLPSECPLLTSLLAVSWWVPCGWQPPDGYNDVASWFSQLCGLLPHYTGLLCVTHIADVIACQSMC